MSNEEYRILANNLKKAKTSKIINDTCVFANVYDGCKCGALSDYYCDGCKFYKSKDEYYLDDGGFATEKRCKNGYSNNFNI